MKKTILLFLSICLVFSTAGCSAGSLLEKYVTQNNSNTQTEETGSDKPRVYMDEVTGRLQDFTGSQLTLISDEQTYIFDVSQATLECSDGMITGDEVSVIYEGQLSSTDTSTVKALKVTDEFHNDTQLEDRTAHCSVLSLTANTITIKADNGKTATYPITGVQQYYQNGISQGTRIYLHFKGKLGKSADGSSSVNAGHVKVLSISDIDPLQIPDPTPTAAPEASADEDNSSAEQTVRQFRGTIQDVSTHLLQVLPTTSDQALTLDLSQIPCYFAGGIAPGSCVTVYYTGEEFDGTTLEGLTVTAVTGDDPENMSSDQMNFTVSGLITGTTSNTVTLQTGDGATITCFTENAQNSSSNGLAIGTGIKVTFNPTLSRKSNIYTSIKIEDM